MPAPTVTAALLHQITLCVPASMHTVEAGTAALSLHTRMHQVVAQLLQGRTVARTTALETFAAAAVLLMHTHGRLGSTLDQIVRDLADTTAPAGSTAPAAAQNPADAVDVATACLVLAVTYGGAEQAMTGWYPPAELLEVFVTCTRYLLS